MSNEANESRPDGPISNDVVYPEISSVEYAKGMNRALRNVKQALINESVDLFHRDKFEEAKALKLFAGWLNDAIRHTVKSIDELSNQDKKQDGCKKKCMSECGGRVEMSETESLAEKDLARHRSQTVNQLHALGQEIRGGCAMRGIKTDCIDTFATIDGNNVESLVGILVRAVFSAYDDLAKLELSQRQELRNRIDDERNCVQSIDEEIQVFGRMIETASLASAVSEIISKLRQQREEIKRLMYPNRRPH